MPSEYVRICTVVPGECWGDDLRGEAALGEIVQGPIEAEDVPDEEEAQADEAPAMP